jgi:DNA invertase Pin-like site-specific DNA recombinase
VRTGALIGYARVSTSGQLLDRQQHALAEAGCLRVFADKLSGKDADRPELAACLDYLRPGDTLVVPSVDRLSRSLADLIGIVGTLRRRRVGFRSLHEALDTTAPGGRLVFHVFAALAEFIRELIVEGTREGLDAARGRGGRLGRPPAMTAEKTFRRDRPQPWYSSDRRAGSARAAPVTRFRSRRPAVTASPRPSRSRPPTSAGKPGRLLTPPCRSGWVTITRSRPTPQGSATSPSRSPAGQRRLTQAQARVLPRRRLQWSPPSGGESGNACRPSQPATRCGGRGSRTASGRA